MSVSRLDKRYLGCILALTAIVVLLMPAGPAVAVILATDENAMPGYHGIQPFHGTWPEENTYKEFHADVHYAVYAPATFEDSFPGEDPSEGTDYVYAYQIFDTGDPGEELIMQLTVGLDGNEVVRNIKAFGVGQAPDEEYFQGSPPTSAAYFYNVNPLPLGGQSNILIFTSLGSPPPLGLWDSATLKGGFATADEQPLPSPLPEPTTLALLGVAAAMLLLFRPTRRRSIVQ